MLRNGTRVPAGSPKRLSCSRHPELAEKGSKVKSLPAALCLLSVPREVPEMVLVTPSRSRPVQVNESDVCVCKRVWWGRTS